MRQLVTTSAFIAIATVVGSCTPGGGSDDWDAALATAKANSRPILLKFGGKW